MTFTMLRTSFFASSREDPIQPQPQKRIDILVALAILRAFDCEKYL